MTFPAIDEVPLSPTVLPVRPASIPEALQKIPRWLIWKVGKKKPGGRYDKIPVHPVTGKATSAHSAEAWLSFNEAVQLSEQGAIRGTKVAGIGIDLSNEGEPVTYREDGTPLYLFGLDFDECVTLGKDRGNTINSEVLQALAELGDPYRELSPSGTGVRAFGLFTKPLKGGNKNGREMYFKGRFLTVTGRGDGDVIEVPPRLEEFEQEWFGKTGLSRNVIALNDDLTAGLERHPPPETPVDVERVNAMLAVISADCSYEDYRQIVWSVCSTEWSCVEDVLRDWSLTAPHRFEEKTLRALIAGYDPARGIGFGTLVHHARENGYVEPVNIAAEFTGRGGDVAAGALFAQKYRNQLLFVHETNDVLEFDPQTGWRHSAPGEEDRAAKGVLVELRDLAAEMYKAAEDDGEVAKRYLSFVERLSKAPNLRAMVDMAKSEDGMTVRLSDFDADPMLLGVSNGVLNLRKNILLPITPDVRVSKRCNVAYDPHARCPQFMAFLKQVQPDPATQKFLSQMAGYCLTGQVTEQKLMFVHGTGANGKSVFIELLAWLLGDYVKKIPTETLMHHQRNPQGPSPDIVALKGVRLAYANETEEGRRLSEARVKDLTGGDTLTGRMPYGKADISFQPTHKLWIVGNHRPEISDSSYGMWRRILLTNFGVTIPDNQRDPRLLDKLKQEGPGILNWILGGLSNWQKNGLSIPRHVHAATRAYQDEQDIIGEWVRDHSNQGSGQSCKKTDLYKAYRVWAYENGLHPLAQSRFTRRLGERGYGLSRDRRKVNGLDLNQPGRRAANKTV